MRRLALLFAPIALAACTVTPPAPTPAPVPDIAASQARTWDAVVDVFAERNIPIRTMERASGFISTDPLMVNIRESGAWADCGKVVGMPLAPDRATYNVLVRGDSVHATAKVTVRWTQGGHPNDPQLIECATKGVWEAAMQAAIKARAETATAAR